MKIGQAIDPRLGHLPTVREAMAKFGGVVRKDLPEQKRAFVALAMQRQYEWMRALEAAGTFGLSFNGHEQLIHDPALRDATADFLEQHGRKDEAAKVRLGETSASANVAAFTVQQLTVVDQVYERTLLDKFADVRVQNQPRAFVHFWKEKAAQDGGDFDEGDLFNTKLDPDYTKIGSEGATSRAADFQMTSSTVTAAENAIHAEWTLSMQQDLASQYGLSMPERGRQFLTLELGREVEGEALESMVSNAANTDVWPKTPVSGSIYETLDPDKWRTTLFRAMTALDNEVYKHTDGFRGTEVMLCDPDSMQLAEDLNALNLLQSGMTRRPTAGNAQIAQGAGEDAGMQQMGRWDCYKVRFMAANTMLFAPKPGGEEQSVAQIHSVYVPITDLGLFLELKTRKVTISAHTRTANVTTRPGLLAKLEIGD